MSSSLSDAVSGGRDAEGHGVPSTWSGRRVGGGLGRRTLGSSLHDDRRHHPGMDRAEIFVGAGFVELEGERLVLVNRAGAEEAIDARNRVRLAVQVTSVDRSEEHTSELQSRFGISYAVFC